MSRFRRQRAGERWGSACISISILLCAGSCKPGGFRQPSRTTGSYRAYLRSSVPGSDQRFSCTRLRETVLRKKSRIGTGIRWGTLSLYLIRLRVAYGIGSLGGNFSKKMTQYKDVMWVTKRSRPLVPLRAATRRPSATLLEYSIPRGGRWDHRSLQCR